MIKATAQTNFIDSTLCLIPARGGSKGIPGKNLRPCHGKPLIDFTIDTALSLFLPSDVLVTSDDDRILNHATKRGIGILKRPLYIAEDDTPMLSVIQHALVCTDYRYKTLLLLQPTSPYRSVNEINAALEKLHNENADLIASVSQVPNENSPYLMMRIIDGQMLSVIPGSIPTRRQDVPKAYLRNGQFYALKTKPIVHGRGLYDGKVLAFETDDIGINLDTEADWAAFVVREGLSHAT
jgi:CMP-N,N'-diacetyllegionaminic acid synthase